MIFSNPLSLRERVRVRAGGRAKCRMQDDE
jgi:hypothetical protein